MKRFKLTILGGVLFFTIPLLSQNGVHVREVKAYDNRSLTIMLEQLNQQLSNVSVIDPQKLSAALGTQQGSQATDVSTSFAITGGAPASPSLPALPDLQTAPTFNPAFSQNVQDLLTEQINLSYRIFDLRMLLERSLTDRLRGENPRLQAVLGLAISIDPPDNAADQAAYVEVAVTAPTGLKTPSLVGLMPESKTYNTSALSTKSSAFGGSAVVKMITVGFNQRRRGQVFYLYQDTDTIALEQLPKRAGDADNTLRFGWSFRPVLGRRTVAAGPRQLFAVVALDADDGAGTAHTLTVKTHTYWKRYNRRTLSTRARDTNLYAENNADTKAFPAVDISPSATYENQLKPKNISIEWHPTDSANAYIKISGANFFTGTKVIIGNATHDGTASGLIIKSTSTMELRAPLSEIASGAGYISGRYGPPVALEDTTPAAGSVGILINEVHFRSTTRDTVPVDVIIQDRRANLLGSLPAGHAPLIKVGDTIIPPPYTVTSVHCVCGRNTPGTPQGNNEIDLVTKCVSSRKSLQEPLVQPASLDLRCLNLHFNAPTSVMTKDNILTIRLPFLPDTAWSDSALVYRPTFVIGVTVIGGKDPVKLAVTGEGFAADSTVVLDKEYKASDNNLTVSNSQLTFSVPKAAIDDYKNLIISGSNLPSPVILALPDKATTPKPKPSVDDGQTFSVAKNSAPSITIKGTDLNGIKTVKFGNQSLASTAAGSNKQLIVTLTRSVTRQAGPATIRLEKDDGSFIPITISVTQ